MERERSSESSSGSPAPRVKPLDWARASGKSALVAQGIERFVRHRRQRRKRNALAAVAGAMLMLIGGLAWQQNRMTTAPASAVAENAEAAATTIVSAPVRRTLPDGSIVELKPGAEIAVEFVAGGSGTRRVALQKGEAHFTVAKDARRPFVVAAGGVEVRAVGTAFSVEWGTRAVEVLVTEGRVAVDQPVARAPAAALLAEVDAGNRAVVAWDEQAKEARVEAVTPTQLSERLAWRVPRLEFNATPLAEVVELFNRHAVPASGGVEAKKLVLADAELEALPLSGLLRADNLTVLLQIMETSYGIRAEPRGDGEIVLRAGR